MDLHSQRSGYSLGENRKQAVRSRGLTPFQYVTVIPNESTKLGDASSYEIVLGWLRSDAASVSLCDRVLEQGYAFPLDDTRYEELLGAIADNAKCADKAEEALSRKAVRERQRGASAGH